MLAVFPKGLQEMRDLFYSQVFDAMHTAAPMLLQIPIRPQQKDEKEAFKMKAGASKSLTSSVRQHRLNQAENARGMTLEEFRSTPCGSLAPSRYKDGTDIYSTISAATEEVGNVINAGGRPFTFDLLLACI